MGDQFGHYELLVTLNSLQGKYAEFMSAYIGLELLLQGQKTWFHLIHAKLVCLFVQLYVYGLQGMYLLYVFFLVFFFLGIHLKLEYPLQPRQGQWPSFCIWITNVFFDEKMFYAYFRSKKTFLKIPKDCFTICIG